MSSSWKSLNSHRTCVCVCVILTDLDEESELLINSKESKSLKEKGNSKNVPEKRRKG